MPARYVGVDFLMVFVSHPRLRFFSQVRAPNAGSLRRTPSTGSSAQLVPARSGSSASFHGISAETPLVRSGSRVGASSLHGAEGSAAAAGASLFGAPPPEDTTPGWFTRADRMYDIADTGGHVVIINPSGTGWWQVEGIAEALRAAQYGLASTVVTLSPTPPPAGLILRHRHIYAAQGNAQDPEAMLAAGVDTARRVIYLAGGSFEDADATAADRRAVLSTNILERQHEEWRKDVFTVVELHVRLFAFWVSRFLRLLSACGLLLACDARSSYARRECF